MLRLLSRFLRALFQFSERAAGEATKFGRSGVELLGVVGAARLECGEPAAESGELIRRQLGNNFSDFFDFHGAEYSTGGAWFSDGKGLIATHSCQCHRFGAFQPSHLRRPREQPGQLVPRQSRKCTARALARKR
jgi:hypothetical protein